MYFYTDKDLDARITEESSDENHLKFGLIHRPFSRRS